MTETYVGFMHPDARRVAWHQMMDTLVHPRHLVIRRAILRNARKAKKRGPAWVRSLQLQCMTIGHVKNFLHKKCQYCGAELE